MAVFAKAMGNGHPMAAIIGRADVMQAAQDSFISSTYWTEGVGPVAALATIRKMQRVDVPSSRGSMIGTRATRRTSADCRSSVRAAEAVRLPGTNVLRLRPPEALALQTLWTVRMLRHGFLTGVGFYPSLAHTSSTSSGIWRLPRRCSPNWDKPYVKATWPAGSAGRSVTVVSLG